MPLLHELFRGTINSTVVHPREVIKMTLKHNTAAAILVVL
ncbi:JAB domain-containing protein [Paenalcaligenes sp. Me131]